MRRIGGRLLWTIVLLCLPTLAAVALGAYFLVERVPEFTHNELVEQMRDAKRNRRGEAFADFRPGALRDRDDQVPWGYTKEFVWYAASTNAAVAYKVPRRDVDNVRLANALYVGGGAFILLLVGMTAFGVRYFVGYMRERDDFLAATAHDLTTPLVGMRMALGRGGDDARVLNERMIRLVENIKDFLRLGGRRTPARRERVDLVKAYGEAYALFREDYRDLFDGEDVPLEADGDAFALADGTLTVQILWNLLGNDLKYAAPFGAVKARIFRTGGSVVLELADDGQGMTPRQMRRAFDRYYRAKTVLESGKGGFGIGLCTAREFAAAMGGALTVRANEPRGCVFALSLPAADGGDR